MGDRLKLIGMHIARYGLAIVLLWIGGMMFTAYQAEGIRPLVANSPLMSWVYRVMSAGGFSSLLVVVEIAMGVLIALRPVWPMGSAVGSGLAAGMFLTTLSFLVTTPGWEPSLGGFPALSAMPGQSLLKDVVLLGAALSSAGVALSWRPPLKVQFTTTRDGGKLTGVYRSLLPRRSMSLRSEHRLPYDNSAKTHRPGLIGSIGPCDGQMARISELAYITRR
jgi:reactive chlorine resistance protein C